MKISGNTILITGGGSGIGRQFAIAFHKLGNDVIVAGRRQSALDETIADHPGMKSLVMDVSSKSSIQEASEKLLSDYPKLNVLFNNAGVMTPENLVGDTLDASVSETIIDTNLLGPIRLTAQLLPHLRSMPYGAILNVSSGLAFVPLAMTPTYCATKAAIHSYTQSLRYQLRDTAIDVIEVIPPYVATEIMPGSTADPRAMPLDDFIQESMNILESRPEVIEVCVDRVGVLRNSGRNGNEIEFFWKFNESLAEN